MPTFKVGQKVTLRQYGQDFPATITRGTTSPTSNVVWLRLRNGRVRWAFTDSLTHGHPKEAPCTPAATPT